MDWVVWILRSQPETSFPTPPSIICLLQKDTINPGFPNPSLFSVCADQQFINVKAAIDPSTMLFIVYLCSGLGQELREPQLQLTDLRERVERDISNYDKQPINQSILTWAII